MAENRFEYAYLEDETIGGHYAEDPELTAIKVRVQELELEEQTVRVKEASDLQPCEMATCGSDRGPFNNMTPEERIDADHRSVYVGNVDYGATADELEIHFNSCGRVNRVTILCDRFSGHPKGFAYIEFSDRDSVLSAIGLHETLFRGRVLKVMPKRTNMPGFSTTDRGGHRGGHSRGNRGHSYHPPGYQNSRLGFRYQSTRLQYQMPHPYYRGPSVEKRPCGQMDYRGQMPKRYPCLLLVTPLSEEQGAGSTGQSYHHPQHTY